MPTYRQETWGLDRRNSLKLVSEAALTMNLDGENKNLITQLYKDEQQSTISKIVSFSPDLSCVSIGPRILVKGGNGHYVDVDGLDLMTEDYPSFFEDVIFRRSHLVLASRANLNVKPASHGRSKANKAEGDMDASKPDPNVETNSSTTSPPLGESKQDPDEEATDDRESVASSSIGESSGWNSAEDSWSESSTQADGDDPCPLAFLDSSSEEESTTGEFDTSSDKDSDSSDKDDASDDPIATFGPRIDDSDSDDSNFELDWDSDESSHGGYSDESDYDPRYESDDDEVWSSDDEEFARAFMRSKGKRKAKVEQGLLAVYDLSSASPVRLFNFSHSLPTQLDSAPPAIHPSKSLVVWPLSSGDILFAEYEGNSYFVRKIKPSTRKGKSSCLSAKPKAYANNLEKLARYSSNLTFRPAGDICTSPPWNHC